MFQSESGSGPALGLGSQYADTEKSKSNDNVNVNVSTSKSSDSEIETYESNYPRTEERERAVEQLNPEYRSFDAVKHLAENDPQVSVP